MWENNKDEYERLFKITQDFLGTTFLSIVLLLIKEETSRFPDTNSSKVSTALLLVQDKMEKGEICKELIERGTIIAEEVVKEVKVLETKVSKGN